MSELPSCAEIAFSTVQNARATATHAITLAEAFKEITGQRHAATVALIREHVTAGRKEDASALKEKLPAFMFSGTFARRKADALQRHSGLLVLDFDGCGIEQKAALAADPHAVLAFVSPSGNGLKLVVSVEADPATHGASFDAARAYFRERFNLDADPTGSDVTRLCFASHDPDAIFKPDAVSLPFEQMQPHDTLHNEDTMNDTVKTQGGLNEDLMRLWDAKGTTALYTVIELIHRTIPKKYGMRHRRALDFARGLRFNCGLPDLNRDQLRTYARQWYETALYAFTTKVFDETFGDIIQGYKDATTPLGEASTAYDVAWKKVKDGKAIAAESKEYEDPRVKNLVNLCFALRDAQNEFYLSARVAGRLLGVSHATANEWMTRMLCSQFKLLKCIKKGNSGEGASIYRWNSSKND